MERILFPIAALILIVLIIYFGEKSTSASQETMDSSPNYPNGDSDATDESDSDGTCDGDADGDCD